MIRLRSTLVLAPLLAAAPAAAQELPRGEVVERVASRANPARGYALYLPSGFAPERKWPVLFLMDPRGRALVPLERFRPAAERYGFVVMSSWHTLSDADSSFAVNEASLDAMLRDAQERFSADARRFYLAGFSGTARHAWHFAERLRGNVAGVMGFGGSFPGPAPLWTAQLRSGRRYAYFGGAGDDDFNHDEMRRLDAILDSLPLPRRLRFYPGEHTWPPEEVAREAVEWMQVQAMKSGLAAHDEPWLDSLLAARSAAARALEATDPAEALREWRILAADFTGLRDAAPAAARADSLARDRGVRRAQARRAELLERERAYRDVLRGWMESFRGGGPVPAHERSLATLRVAALAREAAGADPLAAAAARRMLSHAYVLAAFYGPREHQADPARAEALRRVGEAVRQVLAPLRQATP
jgi:predicted esterase